MIADQRPSEVARRPRLSRTLTQGLAALLLIILSPPSAAAMDLNLDGYSDFEDLVQFIRCMGAPKVKRERSCILADGDRNGAITAADFGFLLSSMGDSTVDPSWSTFETASTHLGRDEILYFHSIEDQRIYRWSIPKSRPLSDILIGAHSTDIAYSSAHDRIYISYSNGSVTQIDASFPDGEQLFLVLELRFELPRSVIAVGRALFVSSQRETLLNYSTYLEDGQRASRMTFPGSYYALESVFDYNEATQTLYISDSRDLPWGWIGTFSIDPITGAISQGVPVNQLGPGLTYGPIRISPDASKIFSGGGRIHAIPESELLSGRSEADDARYDALWLDSEALLLFRLQAAPEPGAEAATFVSYAGPELLPYQSETRLPGSLLGAFKTSKGLRVVTSIQGKPTLHPYAISDDVDSDGVPNGADAFPEDAAASIDEDRDGQPERWNAGYVPGSSNTPLRIDVFPNEPACQFAEHAHPIRPLDCDPGRIAPASYTPVATTVDSQGMLYLLSWRHDRVFRYSLPGDYHETSVSITPPRVIEDDGDFYYFDRGTSMVYVPAHDRVYLGYTNGRVTVLEPDLQGGMTEIDFATVPGSAAHMVAIGDNLLVMSSSGDRDASAIFNSQGDRLAETSGALTGGIAYSAHAETLFYHNRSGGLTYRAIDPTTSAVGVSRSTRQSIYNVHPMRAWSDGPRIALANGVLINTETLQQVGLLPIDYHDAVWRPDGSLITIREASAESTAIEWWNPSGELRERRDIEGEPQAIHEFGGSLFVATSASNPFVFLYTMTDD